MHILLVGLVGQLFIPDKVFVDANQITIQHIFKTHIYLKDVVSITERISTRWKKRFYSIDTNQGSYEADDADFLHDGGDNIIKHAGLIKKEINEGNISRIYCQPQADCANYRHLRRASNREQNFFDLYMKTVFSFLGLFLMIPSGYCSIHPENFKDLYPTWVSAEKPISLKLAKVLSIVLFIMGLLSVLFVNVIMVHVK
jgi:hypothetical protein